MIEAEVVHVFDDPLAHGFVEFSQRRNAAEDPAAAVVDDDKAPVDAAFELLHNPRRVAVVDRGQIAGDANVRTHWIALAEER